MPRSSDNALPTPRGGNVGGRAGPFNGRRPRAANLAAVPSAGNGQPPGGESEPGSWQPIEGEPGWEYEPGGGGLRRAATSRGGARLYLSRTPEVLARQVILGPDGEPANERFRLRRTDGLEVTISIAELERGEAWQRLGLSGKHSTTRAAIYDMLKDQAAGLAPVHGL